MMDHLAIFETAHFAAANLQYSPFSEKKHRIASYHIQLTRANLEFWLYRHLQRTVSTVSSKLWHVLFWHTLYMILYGTDVITQLAHLIRVRLK